MSKLRNTNEILEQLQTGWTKYKDRLDKVLTPTQVRIIQRRLFNKHSFEKLGVRYAQNTTSTKMLFQWSVRKISSKINKDFAEQIELYNSILAARENRLNK